ncbi:MAG: hypothetical protein K6B65_07330 [Bacilli bacterium]|nr:hypothetical protein [Bacilli bacterium]
MKRKQYIVWLFAVFGIFGTAYGGYLLLWHFNHGNGLRPMALILLILGVISLLFFIAFLIYGLLVAKKRKDVASNSPMEEAKPEAPKEEKPEMPKEEKPEETPEAEEEPMPRQYQERPRPSYRYPSYSTVYVRLVGYGPVLRIEGPRILDMRSNAYYRIEGNMVYEEGGGPRFEIRGSQIRDAFGGYTYELSGSNINKVFGGFYASISGNCITLFDSSEKYEISDSLSRNQILVLAALLFGRG